MGMGCSLVLAQWLGWWLGILESWVQAPLAAELIHQGVESACHPSEVGEMSTSLSACTGRGALHQRHSCASRNDSNPAAKLPYDHMGMGWCSLNTTSFPLHISTHSLISPLGFEITMTGLTQSVGPSTGSIMSCSISYWIFASTLLRNPNGGVLTGWATGLTSGSIVSLTWQLCSFRPLWKPAQTRVSDLPRTSPSLLPRTFSYLSG